MAIPLLIPLALGAAGAIASGVSASRSNKASRQYAINVQKANNAVILDLMRQRRDRTRQLSSRSMELAGQVTNAVGAGNVAGQSIDDIHSVVAQDAAMDQASIDAEAKARIAAAETDKRSAVATAQASMQPVGLAAAQGGIAGFQLGTSIVSGIQAIKDATAQARLLEADAVLGNQEAAAQAAHVREMIPLQRMSLVLQMGGFALQAKSAVDDAGLTLSKLRSATSFAERMGR